MENNSCLQYKLNRCEEFYCTAVKEVNLVRGGDLCQWSQVLSALEFVHRANEEKSIECVLSGLHLMREALARFCQAETPPDDFEPVINLIRALASVLEVLKD